MATDYTYTTVGNDYFITIDNVISYLLEHELINIETIVDGDLQIFDLSRKNRNILVMRKNNTSFLLKQPNQNNRYSSIPMKREALLYALVQNDKDFLSLVDIIPHIIDFDEERIILVTEFVKGYSWNEYMYSSNDLSIDKEAVSLLGKVLGTYHHAFELTSNQKFDFLPKTISFEQFLIHPGPEIFTNLSQANMKLLKIIQNHQSIGDLLEGILSSWKPQTLVHGDMKFDNIIISSGLDRDNKSINKLLIIDWEFANIGDPAWDIGSIFQEFMKAWLSLLPMTGILSAEHLIKISSESFRNMQKLLRVFWYSYCDEIAKSPDELNDLLFRAANFCSCRLIQSTYEMFQSQTELNNLGIYMVQISLNMLTDIRKAIIHLLGIPFKLEM